MHDRPAARPAELGLGIAALVLCVALTGARIAWDPVQTLLWTDRDLARALTVWPALPTGGAELNYGEGARVPGGSYYVVLWALLAVLPDPGALGPVLRGLDGLAGLVVGLVAWRTRGPVAGGVGALVTVSAMAARIPTTWVWNPAFVVPATAAGLALLAAALRGRRGAWAAWGVVLGVGAQIHLTVGLWLGVAALAAVALRRRAALPGVGTALGVAALLQLPFLALELGRGWPNLRRLVHQQPLTDAATGRPVTLAPAELADAVSRLTPAGSHLFRPALEDLHLAGALVIGLALVGGVHAWRTRGTAADLARVASMVAVALVAVPALGPSVQVENRYLLGAVPPLALLAGWGGAAVAHRHRALGWIAVLAAAVVPVADLVDLARHPRRDHPQTWAGATVALDAIAAVTGWSLGEIAGRTSWLGPQPGGDLGLSAELPVVARLILRGEPVLGAQPPPCAVIVADEVPLTVERLAAALGRPAEALRLRDAHPLPLGLTLHLVDLDAEACPTTMASPYVRLPSDPPEPPDLTQPVGTARPITVASPSHRWVLRLATPLGDTPDGPPVQVALTATPQPGAVGWTLSSQQLRGPSYNDNGALRRADLGRITLRLDGPDGPQTVPWITHGVGRNGVATPLHLTTPLASGSWTVTVEVEVAAAAELPGADTTPPLLQRIAVGTVDVP